MKSDLQLLILPEATTEHDDLTEQHWCKVLCMYEFESRWHEHSILDAIVVSAWRNNRQWNYSQMLQRRPLSAINGRPC